MGQKIVSFFRSRKHIINRQIAEYVAHKDMENFNEVYNLLKEQSEQSCLFKDIDFMKYYNLIMADMISQKYNSDNELHFQVVNEIVSLCSDRSDIKQLREELENNNNKPGGNQK